MNLAYRRSASLRLERDESRDRFWCRGQRLQMRPKAPRLVDFQIGAIAAKRRLGIRALEASEGRIPVPLGRAVGLAASWNNLRS